MTVSSDAILTAETVPSFVMEHVKELQQGGLNIPENATWTATAIAGGNVNFAFCVTCNEQSDIQVFVKQAPEYVAIFGPTGFPLTSDRMQAELDVYNEWKTLLGPNLSSKYLPVIYCFDEKRMTVMMEFLQGYTLLDHVLVGDAVLDVHDSIAVGLGEFMGVTHAKTHSSIVDEDRKSYLKTHFENMPMRNVQLEFVFTKCYKESTAEQRVGLDMSDAFLQEMEVLRRQYFGETDSLVLSHGDFHPGSVMVDCAAGGVKVIDPEFTVYGPPGLDVGSLLSGYLLGCVHQVYCDRPDSARKILSDCRTIWKSYCTALNENGLNGDTLIRQIEIETVGFTAAEVCRTAMEFAGGRKWLQFDDKTKKAAANKAALQIVDRCMIARHEGGLDLLWKAMEDTIAAGNQA